MLGPKEGEKEVIDPLDNDDAETSKLELHEANSSIKHTKTNSRTFIGGFHHSN